MGTDKREPTHSKDPNYQTAYNAAEKIFSAAKKQHNIEEELETTPWSTAKLRLLQPLPLSTLNEEYPLLVEMITAHTIGYGLVDGDEITEIGYGINTSQGYIFLSFSLQRNTYSLKEEHLIQMVRGYDSKIMWRKGLMIWEGKELNYSTSHIGEDPALIGNTLTEADILIEILLEEGKYRSTYVSENSSFG